MFNGSSYFNYVFLYSYLWKHFDAIHASPAYLMSMIMMINEKFRENVEVWRMFLHLFTAHSLLTSKFHIFSFISLVFSRFSHPTRRILCISSMFIFNETSVIKII